LSGAVDASILMLTVQGRRTKRHISLPVQYAAGEDALWVWVGDPQSKSWWRNLDVESPVRVRLRGQELDGTASVIRDTDQASVFDKGVDAYARRFPRSARRIRSRSAEREPLAQKRDAVVVRLHIPPQALTKARAATVVPGAGAVAMARRHPLGAFFVVAFALSWTYWIPIALSGGHLSHFPGLLGPMLAALLVTALTDGWKGVRDLVDRMTRWRVSWKWYAVAGIPVAAALVALGIEAMVGRDLPSLDRLGDMPGLPKVGWVLLFAVALLINGFGEETGWRGFAWSRLRERHSLAGAALFLAVPWALWHVPTFWLDTGMSGFSLLMVPGFVIALASGAVVLGWLYERANSSILIVALWHTMLNMVSATRGAEGIIAAVVSGVVIVWAVMILRSEARQTTLGRSTTSGSLPAASYVRGSA
jgi:uncharacterized protein